MGKPTILDTILAHKQREITAREALKPLAELKARANDLPPTREFLKALQTPKSGQVALIAEVKKASPSAGVIRADFHPVLIARIYEEFGASCLSVLTDEKFFSGHDDYLRAIRQAVMLPILRKDFTLGEWQIYESRLLGADAVLLIAAALSPTLLSDLYSLARRLGMAALVEVHTQAEMEVALTIEAELIGINSRDLSEFVTDLGTFEKLAGQVPPSITLVAESGIRTSADVRRVAEAGAKAILVGETLMRSENIGIAIKELMGN